MLSSELTLLTLLIRRKITGILYYVQVFYSESNEILHLEFTLLLDGYHGYTLSRYDVNICIVPVGDYYD